MVEEDIFRLMGSSHERLQIHVFLEQHGNHTRGKLGKENKQRNYLENKKHT